MPVRAPAPYLEEALDAVLGQDPAPDEVVVVDDASEPPIRLAERHAARCVLKRLGDPGGPATARAAGLAASTAELVALADADDVWEPGKLAAQLEALAAHPEAAVCFGRAEVIAPDGGPAAERLPELRAGLLPADELRPLLFDRNAIPAATAVIRRAPLEAVGGFAGSRTAEPLAAASDWELWLRLVAAGHAFACEPKARIRYRRHAGAVTSDLVRLARSSLAVHEAHAELVDADTQRPVRARDLVSLGRALIRERRWAEARDALAQAAEQQPLAPRDRLVRFLAVVPGVRAALGRRDPYRRAASS